MESMFDNCVILAGGSGARLWPASHAEKPKQFLPLSQAHGSERTFFHAALERALGVTKAEGQVIVIAGEGHAPHIVRICGTLDEKTRSRLILIPEPLAKNTAPAIICGIVYAERAGGGKQTMLVITSDHSIGPLEDFKQDAARAAAQAEQDALVVFGIPPNGPDTGYGYIETGALLSSGVYSVRSFHEKPDRPTAEQFIAAGRFYWNSGMFAFSSGYMLQEFRRHAPEIALPFDGLEAPGENDYTETQGVRILSHWQNLKQAYTQAKNISFDYAIAEKCGQTLMVAGSFAWRDLGSWDAYAELLGATAAETYRSGSESCFVDSDMPVALCGVEDLIVAVRSGKDGAPGAVLIAKKGETQRVREIVEQIKLAGRTKLL